MRYEEMRSKLSQALKKYNSQKNAAGNSPAAGGTLEKDYIKKQIGEQMVPMALRCYEEIIETEPGFGGDITLQFEIVGEEGIGGVVQNAKVINAEKNPTTIDHPVFEECMQDAISATTFDAPKGGGSVTVNYPFKFRSGPPVLCPESQDSRCPDNSLGCLRQAKCAGKESLKCNKDVSRDCSICECVKE